MMLSEENKVSLLKLARDTIERNITKAASITHREKMEEESLKINCGVFVSIYVNKKLRGCIGTFSEDEPLYRNVQEMALSAATSDTRFKPLEPDELDNMSIEISVLSPRRQISGIDEIILGKHGIYIKKGHHRGTLLPQVAINQNWNVDEFLGNCSKYKAGIGWDGWKGADIFIYEAIVFNSRDFGEQC